MKKLLVLLFALVLVVALAACGTPDETTPGTTPKTNTTTPEVTTTSADTSAAPPPVVTTQAPGTDEPKLPGVDILNGDFENMAITPNWKGADACAFEEHAALNFNVALVVHMQYCESSIYEELILTTDAEASNQSNWELNESYRWVVVIDGKEIEIERFSILNDRDSGYVRMDLGSDWKYSDDVDDSGYHNYEIWLKIYDKTAEGTDPAFWAYLTDPDWNGPYMFKKPEPIIMLDDADRDPSHVALPAKDAQPLSGPAGMAAETYNLLFDGDVRSKLCTRDIAEPITFKYDSAIHLLSYSLVNANDDASYPERTPLAWKLYGSHDGSQWDLIDSQELTETDNTNYQERNFKLSKEAEYSYFKFEPIISGEMYQLSEIIMYTSADYLG